MNDKATMCKLINSILNNSDGSNEMFEIGYHLCELLENNSEKYGINKLEYNDYTDVEDKLENYLSDMEE